MREATCGVCGQGFQARFRGPLPIRCETCNREHVRRQEQARRDRLTEGRMVREAPRCLGCGAELPYNGRGRPRQRCAPCLAEWTRTEGTRRSREWIEANPERAREKDRRVYQHRAERVRQAKLDEHLRRKYGLERADFDRMLAEQRNCCRICGREPNGKTRQSSTLHVDHDHATGRVRGLLCGKCNTMVGLAGEDPAVLLAAVKYLRKG
jgi:Autographiviridae endonuclease VII